MYLTLAMVGIRVVWFQLICQVSALFRESEFIHLAKIKKQFDGLHIHYSDLRKDAAVDA